MSPGAITWGDADWALFLDVDGTLLEIAETPQAVRVSESLKELLSQLSSKLDGALALVSGRSLADLDALFAPLRLCAAGVHGCERRDVQGSLVRTAIDRTQIVAARAALERFIQEHEGLLLEDKGISLAVHFRRAPDLAPLVRAELAQICEQLGSTFAIQAGKCVFELRPSHCTKGQSIAAFMRQPPFAGRVPMFLGDDVTDEDGFAIVNQMGGLSIRVGGPATTLAQQRLPSVSQAIAWLRDVAAGLHPARRSES